MSWRYDLEPTFFETYPELDELFEAFDIELGEQEWEAEINRSSSDYIRWVQQSLNRILGLRLAVDGISGTMTRSAIRSFQQKNGLAVDSIVGPQTEGALIAAGAAWAPGSTGAPAVQPTPAPTPSDLPATWSNGPVPPPVWRPQMVSYNSITCGSREIPVGLRPESVTQGWTARAQAIVNIIRGPLFGWKNVEGGATGDQTGHVSGSYHYCGRAIDSFAPGVLWNTRATGAGLSASWRLANWAAQNAAALNISEVIFYDLIWTVAKGGWRPYRNPGLSGKPDWENSLQHRDHVHISVY